MDVEVTQVAPGVHHARVTHVGWTLVVDGGEVTVVDAGLPRDRERVVASLDRVGRRPADVAAVVLTHGHPDHVGAAAWLQRAHGARVHAHPDEAANVRGERIEQVGEARLLRMAWRPRVARWMLDVLREGIARPDRPDDLVLDGAGPLDVPGSPTLVPTPGHTSGHSALHLGDRGVLLAGDALMTRHALAPREGPRLLPDFFNTDTAWARRSLEALRGLAADVVVPGHGPAFHGSPARAVELALAAP